jgi:hypothetical protein
MREVLRLIGLALSLALVGYPLTLSTDDRVVGACVVAGCALVNALVLWSDGAVTTAVAAVCVAYAVALAVSDVPVDLLVPLVAGGLLALVDGCDLGLAVPPARPVDRGVLLLALRSMARSFLTGAAAAGVVVLVGVGMPAAGGGARLLAMAGALLAVIVVVLAPPRIAP